MHFAYSTKAQKQFKKLDNTIQKKNQKLHERITNPR